MPSGWTRASRALPVLVCAVVLVPRPAFADLPEETPVAVSAPAAPGDLVVTPASGRLDVAWSAPAADGGSEVTDYEVTATAPGEPVAAVVVAGTSAAVEALKDGVTYDVSVVARNASGASPAAATTATPRSAPGAPKITGITAGNRSVTVTWSPPASDGGAGIAWYEVVVAPGGQVAAVTGGSTRVTVAGLTNGTAVTATVVAVNAAGPSTPSAPSARVVPRQPVRMSVVTPPAATAVHGTASAVRAAVRDLRGTGVAGVQVELWAKVRPKTAYARVAVGSTGSTGYVTLRTTLPATAALLLRHPPGRLSAPDVAVRGVHVATKVGATPSATRIRIGQSVTVRGAISPAHPTGSVVRLQRHTSDGWVTVASGRMTTSTAYRVTWRPGREAAYALRVVKPADADHALGKSATWTQRVVPQSAADIAREIDADGGISLDTVHTSGVRDLATAQQNITDVAAGRLARRSAYENAPGGYTAVDLRVLKALRRMGQLGRVTVSEIAGGSHSRGSAHYYGRGIDISWVNGVHVRPGSAYWMVVEACRAFGAARVFHPGYDPYGGHQGHVHCDWA